MNKSFPEDHLASVALGADGKLEYTPAYIDLSKNSDNNLQVTPNDNDIVVKISDHPEHFSRLSSVMVSLTNACNLNCNYCYEQHQTDFGTYTVESVKKIMDFLLAINSLKDKNLIFFGGEPLIHKNLILGFLKEHQKELNYHFEKSDFKINIVSNGLLLTNAFIDEYFSYPFTNMIISLDTFDADIDDRNIGQKKLDRLKETIAKMPLKVKNDKRVCVRPTIGFETALTMPLFLETLYQELGIRYFIIQPLIMGNADGFLNWPEERWDTLKEEILKFIRRHDDIEIEVTEGVGTKSAGNNCLSGYDIVSVDPSGDFSGCFFFVNQKEKTGDLISGNVFQNKLFIEREKSFTKSFKTMFETNEECKACDLNDHCYQCPAGNLDTGKQLFRPDGMCKRFVQFYLDVKDELAQKKFKNTVNMVANIEKPVAKADEGDLLTNSLNRCQDLSIYLGGRCNFDCSYCDRSNVGEMGYQKFENEDIPLAIKFFESQCIDGELPVDIISFFGGEPLLFVAVMDKLMDAVDEKGWTKTKFFLQTNGSLILKNKAFIEKWGPRLRVSISYDFSFQNDNRTAFDIEKTLVLLKESKVDFIQFQHVLPVTRPDAFSVDHLGSIVKLFGRYKVDRLSIIPLRHLRGHGRFRTFVDEVPLPLVFQKLTQLVQLLWVYGINTVVDGMEGKIEKSYFHDHKQLILSPDGYLYPEYDFIEYKVEEARIGSWKDEIKLDRDINDDHLIWPTCHTCPARGECGIKYLFHIFETEPDGSCLDVNRTYMLLNRHNLKLKESPNLLQTIGVQ